MATKLTEVLLDKDKGYGDGNHYILWCDLEVAQIINGMPGVQIPYIDEAAGPPYTIVLDPRFDRNELEAEIQAQW